MAEVKFNFYKIYKEYYKNINDINRFNLYVIPYYDFCIITSYEMETISKFHKIILTLYVLYELNIIKNIDYRIYKYMRIIYFQKIFVKTIFKFTKHVKLLNFNKKFYNLFKL